MPPKKKKRFALVLSGGGARGAYEAGVIHYIRTMLPSPLRDHQFDIFCGNSVGALNIAFMASTAQDPNMQGRKLCEHWENMREEYLYRRDLTALLELVYKNSKGFVFNLFRDVKNRTSYLSGILDNTPLSSYLKKKISWKGIAQNVRSHRIQAVSIVATNVLDGSAELFIAKDAQVQYRGDLKVHFGPILPLHVQASAAIPILFPTVNVNGVPYTDGGLSLNTPLSPAIQLGADKILVIGLHGRLKPGEHNPAQELHGQEAPSSMVLGRVMDSLFVNNVESDLDQLGRINRLLAAGEAIYGKDFLEKLNAQLRAEKHKTFSHGFRPLEVFSIQPSENLGKIFTYCYEKRRDDYFSTFEKVLFRITDIDPTSGNEFLSYISFMPYYLKTLLYLGFEDARKQHNQLQKFFEQE